MSDKIEIKLKGKKLTPEKFLEAVESFFALIQGVAKNVATHPVNWTVEVEKSSALVRAKVENPSEESNQSIDAVVRGINALRTGIRAVPFGFTKDEVRAARKLAALKSENEIESIFILNGGAPEDVSEEIIRTAEAILVGENHIAFGSIEGEIVNISLRHTFCCTIYEPIYRREVVCNLQKKEAQDAALKSVSKRLKVIANGLIHYSKEGHPVNITADTIEIFPEKSDLPTSKEIQAIYRKYK